MIKVDSPTLRMRRQKRKVLEVIVLNITAIS